MESFGNSSDNESFLEIEKKLNEEKHKNEDQPTYEELNISDASEIAFDQKNSSQMDIGH